MELKKKTISDEVVLNYDAALERLGGDEGLLQEVIQVFIDDSSNLLSEVDSSLLKKDSLELKRAFHSIKGASANIGGEQLNMLSAILEQEALAGNFSGVDENLGFFKESTRTLVEELRKKLS